MHRISTGALSITESVSETSEYLTRHRNALLEAVNDLRTIQNFTPTNSLTSSIDELETKQRSLLINAKRILESQMDHTMAEVFPVKADVSKKVYALFAKRTSDLFYGSYTRQQFEISALFEDLFTGSRDTMRQQSGLAPLFDSIKAVNSELLSAMEERLNSPKQEKSTREVKTIMRFRLDKILNHIAGNCVDRIEPFMAIADPVNDLITENMANKSGFLCLAHQHCADPS